MITGNNDVRSSSQTADPMSVSKQKNGNISCTKQFNFSKSTSKSGNYSTAPLNDGCGGRGGGQTGGQRGGSGQFVDGGGSGSLNFDMGCDIDAETLSQMLDDDF